MKAIELKTDYLTNPVGLGNFTPRFYFKCEGGKKQKAYQIQAFIENDKVWDSGKVYSDKTAGIPYKGEPLMSRDIVNYKIWLWDENDKIGEVAKASFELGLKKEDFRAKWITGNYEVKKNERYPADYFKKEFRLKGKVYKARLYMTALGVYEASINSQMIEDFKLAPGATDYRKRLQYQTYDVTKYIKEENKIEVILADGWYRGSIGCFGKTNVFGKVTAFLAQLEIEYADGTIELITSDESWDWCNNGPILFADLKDGEIIDAGKKPGYEGKAKLYEADNIFTPLASDNVYPCKHERFRGKLIISPKGDKIIDFGQNIAGFLSFRIKGEKGKKIRILLGETLDENNEFTQSNFQETKPVKEFGTLTEILLITGNRKLIHKEMQPTPKQEIVFICSGNEDYYETKFSIFGFRYAKVETDIGITGDEFESIAVYSSFEKTGEFECSDEMINKLYHNALWSMKSNFLDVPTDCPTRERLGWTGDAQIFFNTATYMANAAPFYKKWLKDMQDNQFDNGKISAVIPYNGVSMVYDNTGSSAGWNDAAILIPYRFYKKYGDIEVLKENYDMMKKCAMFMINNTGHKKKKEAKADPYNKYVYEKGTQLGEWLEPKEFQDMANAAGGKLVSQTETATGYFAYSMSIMEKVAEILNKKEDAKLYKEYNEGAKKAYRHLFLNDNIPDTLRQAKYVRPLAFDLADESQKDELVTRLVKAIEARKYKIGTGFLSTPFVLKVLCENNHADIAYKMLFNKECPGWLYPVSKGATTIWEDWQGIGKCSLNHYSFGSVCEFMYDTISGINMDGENKFVIKPVPGDGLTNAKASYDSIYGKVTSSWKKEEGKIIFDIEIPSNTTAKIILPNKEEYMVDAGHYTYTIKQ